MSKMIIANQLANVGSCRHSNLLIALCRNLQFQIISIFYIIHVPFSSIYLMLCARRLLTRLNGRQFLFKIKDFLCVSYSYRYYKVINWLYGLRLLRRQLRFRKFFNRVDPIIRVHAFSE